MPPAGGPGHAGTRRHALGLGRQVWSRAPGPKAGSGVPRALCPERRAFCPSSRAQEKPDGREGTAPRSAGWSRPWGGSSHPAGGMGVGACPPRQGPAGLRTSPCALPPCPSAALSRTLCFPRTGRRPSILPFASSGRPENEVFVTRSATRPPHSAPPAGVNSPAAHNPRGGRGRVGSLVARGYSAGCGRSGDLKELCSGGPCPAQSQPAAESTPSPPLRRPGSSR